MARSLVLAGSMLIDAGANKLTNLADGVAATDAATVGQVAAGGAVASVFGRTAAVVAVTGDYYGVVSSALTGATQSSRYVGATTSGAPVSGTFAVGDFVVARNGHFWICTVAGSPGTWVDVAGTVASVTAADASITVAGTAANPTVATGTLDNIAAQHPAVADWSNNTHKITSVKDPTAAQDAATKNYVDAAVGPSTGRGVLLYDYEVAGSDKASIDTAVDGAYAGSFPGTYIVLELWIYGRTDEAVTQSTVNMNVNGDTGSHYWRSRIGATGGTVSAGGSPGTVTTALQFSLAGTSIAAGFASVLQATFPAYASTVFNRQAIGLNIISDSTAGNTFEQEFAYTWVSTSAITSIAITPATAAKKFKVGTRFTVFAR